MKKLSLVAAVALLFAGAQLHAQGTTKQDTTKKKAASTAMKGAKSAEKPATATKSDAKTAQKAAGSATSEKMSKKGGSKKKGMKKDTTAKKP